MNFKHKYILLLITLFIIPNVKAGEKIYLYKGTFSRTIQIEDLYKFKQTKIASPKLKNLIKITNQNEKELHKILSMK